MKGQVTNRRKSRQDAHLSEVAGLHDDLTTFKRLVRTELMRQRIYESGFLLRADLGGGKRKQAFGMATDQLDVGHLLTIQ